MKLFYRRVLRYPRVRAVLGALVEETGTTAAGQNPPSSHIDRTLALVRRAPNADFNDIPNTSRKRGHGASLLAINIILMNKTDLSSE